MKTWQEVARSMTRQLSENGCQFNDDGDLVAIGRLREALTVICEAADCRASNWRDPLDNCELFEESEETRLEIAERIADAIEDVQRLLGHFSE